VPKNRLALVLGIVGFLSVEVAYTQGSICFEDDDGARWEIELQPNGNAVGTVEIPVGGCEAGRVVGNYAFADATFPFQLFIPPDLAACVPRSSLSGQFTLDAGGRGEIIVQGELQELILFPCTEGVRAGSEGWWSGRPVGE